VRRFRLGLRGFLDNGSQLLDIWSVDGYEIVGIGRHPFSVGRRKYTQFAAEPVGKTILNGVRMRCHRHAHVLQFANDLGIVAIKLAG
jgi:hypothetical protein